MSYTLQALIMNRPLENDLAEVGLTSVLLGDELFIVPLTYEFVESKGMGLLPLTDDGLDYLPEPLQNLCENISYNTRVIYVEAEFFGGAGTQACALFENSNLIEGPRIDENAINYGLMWLGVPKGQNEDQFSVLGLGRHRSTEAWLNA